MGFLQNQTGVRVSAAAAKLYRGDRPCTRQLIRLCLSVSTVKCNMVVVAIIVLVEACNEWCSGLCSSILDANNENIVDRLLQDVYQGRFLPRHELCLPASPIRTERCQRQCMKDCEQVLSSPAVYHSSGAALSSSG